jgi:flagellar protein FlbD
MITLTRLNQTSVVVNADLIAYIEHTSDTFLIMANGDRVAVRESVDQVVERAVEYQQRVRAGIAPSR